MSVKTYWRYTLECEGCGDELDDLYEEDIDAEEAGAKFGWVRTSDYGHACKECSDDDAPVPGSDS